MNSKICFGLVVSLVLPLSCQSEELSEDVLAGVRNVVAGLPEKDRNLARVADLGFSSPRSLSWERLSIAVSNHFDSVLAEPYRYATNQLERFVLMRTGWAYDEAYYLHFYDKLLDLCCNGLLSYSDLRWYRTAHRDPIRMNILAMNYDQPGVSNMVYKYLEVSGRTNHCHRILSGAAKSEFLSVYGEMTSPKTLDSVEE